MEVNHSKQSKCFNTPGIKTDSLLFIIKILIQHQYQAHNKFFEDESISLIKLVFIFLSLIVPILHKQNNDDLLKKY